MHLALTLGVLAFVGIVACEAEPEVPLTDPHQQAVERLLEFPPEASEFEDPKLRSLELVRHEDRDAVMALLPLEPGMVVADVGCGIGWFSFDLARAVGAAGRVFAVDLEPRYLEVLAERMGDPSYPHPGNISTVQGVEDQLPLEPASVDLAFLSHLDFHLVRPLAPAHHVDLLRSVGAALRPDGRVVVLQWLGAREGVTTEDLIANYGDLGFTLEARHDLADHGSVLLILRR
jgi:SAM-dependent methyltransferase